jgi:uncharacterized membrane protein YGL010W
MHIIIVYPTVQMTILKIIKNTHRHPVNQALHFIGVPFYGVGLAMILGHLAGIHTNLATGGAMLLAAIAMFVLGHKIEGNLRMMAPVLLFRFLLVVLLLSGRRKIARDSFAKRVHLLGT